MKEKDLLRAYSLPGVIEVIYFRDNQRKITACWVCSHRPCVCPDMKNVSLVDICNKYGVDII